MFNQRQLRKWIALAVSLMLLLSACPTGLLGAITASAEEVPITVWDGTKVAPTVGTGTSADPYQISTPQQLAYVAGNADTDNETKGKYYKLMNDIYLNDVSADNWYESGQNKTWVQGKFYGNFNGDGHTVYGLWSCEDRFGLFMYASGASIYNVAIDKLYYNCSATTGVVRGGSIVSTTDGATVSISNCYIQNAYLRNTAFGDWGGLGGIAGFCNSSVTISNTAFKGEINGPSSVNCYGTGTIVGVINSSNPANIKLQISNSYVLGTNITTVGNPINSMVSVFSTSATYTNADATKLAWGPDTTKFGIHVDAANMVGELATANMSALDYEYTWTTREDDTPIQKIFAPAEEEEEDENGIWNGKKVAPTQGTGTSADPYQISTPQQLAYIAGNTAADNETKGKYYKLMNDVYLNDVSADNWYESDQNKTWVQGNFYGNFNGDGHTVYGLWSCETRFGLFMYASGASIYNVAIDKLYYNCSATTDVVVRGGSIVSTTDGAAVSISNCYIQNAYLRNTASGNWGGLGGIAGFCNSSVTISNTAFKGEINGPSSVSYYGTGTIVGVINSSNPANIKLQISNSYVLGTNITTVGNPINSMVSVFSTSATYTNATDLAWGTDTTKFGIHVDAENTVGEQAKTSMPNLDYQTVWVTRENDTPIQKIFAPAEEEQVNGIWNGTTKAPAQGTGIAADPYLIATAENLAWVVSGACDKTVGTAGKYFKLVDDIQLNDISQDNWMENEWYSPAPITDANGSVTNCFGGTFDGDGHTIYGLYSEGENGVGGLFPYAHGATIKNLKISKAYFEATSAGAAVGVIVGADKSTPNGSWNATLTISNCYIDSDVEIYAENSGANTSLGGIIGYTTTYFNVTNSCFNGIIGCDSSAAAIGGIVARYWNQGNGTGGASGGTAVRNVNYCYVSNNDPVVAVSANSVQSANANSSYSPAAAYSSACSGNISLAAGKMISRYAKTYMTEFDFNTVWSAVRCGLPMQKIFFDKTELAVPGEQGDINEDTVIDIRDLVLIKKYLTNVTDIDTSLADCDDDLQVNATDLSLLIKYLLGVTININGLISVSATNENILYTGRWTEDNGSMVSSFEGSMEMKFEGTSIELASGSSGIIRYSIDNGNLSNPVDITNTKVLAKDLANAEHTIRIYPYNEWTNVRINGFLLKGTVSTLTRTNKIIEFIGDSITQGYLGIDQNGLDINDTCKTYAHLTAKALGFDRSIVAQNGLTVTPGYHVDKLGYQRYFQTNKYGGAAGTWDTSTYTPDYLVINLGTNDHFNSVPQAEIKSAYLSFLQQLRTAYPNTEIIVMTPFVGNYTKPLVAIYEAFEEFDDSNSRYINTIAWLESTDFVSDGVHPSEAGQVKITNKLVEVLSSEPSEPGDQDLITPMLQMTGGADTDVNTRKSTILNASDALPAATGTTYYVSANGSDSTLGTSEQNPGSVTALNNASLQAGDKVLFKRGDTFRLTSGIITTAGVSYGAYGTGDKPQIYGSAMNYASADWQNIGGNIWSLRLPRAETGNIYFIKNGTTASGCQKQSLSAITQNGDFYHDTVNKIIYVYSETPLSNYEDIEIATAMALFSVKNNVNIDNLCLKYSGTFGIKNESIESTSNVKITNCEIGFIGGSHLAGENVRYGNGIEFYGESSDITVQNCYVYQCYDAGITVQGRYVTISDISFTGNLVEYCTYGIEYYNYYQDEEHFKTGTYNNVTVSNNIIRFAGYGWTIGEGQRDHWLAVSNLTGWRYLVPNTTNFNVQNNIFDCSLTNLVFWFWTENNSEHPGVTVSGNSFYQKACTLDVESYKWIQTNSTINFGKSPDLNGNKHFAIDQSTLETAVAVFDSNPNTVLWLNN